MNTSAEDIAAWRAQFEKHGAATVRAMLPEWQGPMKLIAMKWLAEKDAEDHLRADSARAEEMDIARSAKDAAWVAARAAERAADAADKANARATIALIIAAVSIIASIIGMLVTHYDALHK
jgi:hypothetical protein